MPDEEPPPLFCWFCRSRPAIMLTPRFHLVCEDCAAAGLHWKDYPNA